MTPKYTREAVLFNGNKKGMMPNSVACDPLKLRKLIYDKGLMLSTVSSSIGFAGNTLSGQLNSGIISGPMASGLKTIYNIDREEYEYIPPREENPKEETEEAVNKGNTESIPINETAMYSVMKQAFVDAFNEALALNAKQIRGLIATAVTYAVRQEATNRAYVSRNETGNAGS